MAFTQSQIGAWLAAAREARGLTQNQAAVAVRKDPGLISKWERGDKRMSAESFLALVKLYDAFQPLRRLLAGEPFDDRPDYIRIAEKHGMQVAEGSPEPPGLERDVTKKPRRKGA